MSRSKPSRVRQGFRCTDCEAFQKVSVDPADADSTIRYYCSDCRQFVEHEPKGSPSWFG